MKEHKLTTHERDILCKVRGFEDWDVWEPSLFELSILEHLYELKLVDVIDERWVVTEEGNWMVVCWMNDEW